MKPPIRPVLLAILDGWGEAPASPGNAVHLARTPNMDRWRQQYPFTTITAHNGAVGLPEGQMGNSEVGHMHLGAGRVIYQDFTRINRAVADGEFFSNPAINQLIDSLEESGGALHLLGLVSDGGVHSHLDHLIAILELAARRNFRRVYVHAFMDGRDTPPKSGIDHLGTLVAAAEKCGAGEVATVCGRYYAMDRDQRWDRVALAWEAVVEGRAEHTVSDPLSAVRQAYERAETDEFIKPTVVVDPAGQAKAMIRDGDGVVFFNFRADRARQLTRALIRPDFSGFAVARQPKLAGLVTMTRYEKDFDLPVAFPPQSLEHILGEEVSRHGLAQLRIAETEKYAHVTYFFNGGREEPFPLEDRALIPSPREVATYDLKPEMSAPQVTEELLRRLSATAYGLVVLNFANCDMVGHSGVLAAAIKACETVDHCIGRVVEAFTAAGGVVLITADHGNAEEMINLKTGGPMTAHTCNPVPLLLIDPTGGGHQLRAGGDLTNLAPTILQLMGLPVPPEMTSTSLLKND